MLTPSIPLTETSDDLVLGEQKMKPYVFYVLEQSGPRTFFNLIAGRVNRVTRVHPPVSASPLREYSDDTAQ